MRVVVIVHDPGRDKLPQSNRPVNRMFSFSIEIFRRDIKLPHCRKIVLTKFAELV